MPVFNSTGILPEIQIGQSITLHHSSLKSDGLVLEVFSTSSTQEFSKRIQDILSRCHHWNFIEQQKSFHKGHIALLTARQVKNCFSTLAPNFVRGNHELKPQLNDLVGEVAGWNLYMADDWYFPSVAIMAMFPIPHTPAVSIPTQICAGCYEEGEGYVEGYSGRMYCKKCA